MEQNVRYHETNEGREAQQGIAGFEGTNALWFLAAIGLSMVLFNGCTGSLKLDFPWPFVVASLPIITVSAYVFGLKQGKPKSYDVELGEWLIIRLTGSSYFSPKAVQPLDLEWVDTEKAQTKWQK